MEWIPRYRLALPAVGRGGRAQSRLVGMEAVSSHAGLCVVRGSARTRQKRHDGDGAADTLVGSGAGETRCSRSRRGSCCHGNHCRAGLSSVVVLRRALELLGQGERWTSTARGRIRCRPGRTFGWLEAGGWMERRGPVKIKISSLPSQCSCETLSIRFLGSGPDPRVNLCALGLSRVKTDADIRTEYTVSRRPL